MPASQAPEPVTESVSELPDPPAPPLRILAFSVVALAAGIGAARWLESGGRNPVAGFLQVRTTCVTAEKPCRIIKLEATSGDRVSIGDALATLSDIQLNEQLQLAQQKVENLKGELAQATARAQVEIALHERDLEERICDARLQSSQYLKEKYDFELTRSMLADLLASHESALWDNGSPMVKSLVLAQKWPNSERMSTVLALERASNAAEVSSANIEICEERINSLERLRAALPKSIEASCGVDLAAARLEQAEQELASLTERQSQLAIESPAVGQVGIYRAQPGAQLNAGDPIVELLDDSQRYLTVEVPSMRIHEFPVSKTLTLLFPGQEKRQGRVSRIAPQTQPRDQSRPMADSIVLVEVEQAGRLWPTVPIGTRIEVLAEEGR